MNRMQAQKVTVYSLSSEIASHDTISDIKDPLRPGCSTFKDIHLRSTLEQMPALLWTTDLDLKIIDVQGNGLGHLRQDSRQVTGMPLEQFFENEAQNFPVLAAHRSALGGLAQAFEFTLDNATFWGYAEPLFNSTWTLMGTIGVAVDISARKIAEESRARLEIRKRETDKHLSLMRLAGGMAQHFNSLLGEILASVERAQVALAGDHPAQSPMRDIEKLAGCATGLAEQLLCFGQRQVKKSAPVNLSRLIRDQFAALQMLLGKSVTLRSDLMEDLPLVAGDPEQLGELLKSLLRQAGESIGAGAGNVVLRTQVVNGPPQVMFAEPPTADLPDGEYVWLEVSDSGCGLSEEAKTRMFEPFPRGNESERDLGLATALGVVHSHCGAITISSKPGHGTACHVFLPVLTTQEHGSKLFA